MKVKSFQTSLVLYPASNKSNHRLVESFRFLLRDGPVKKYKTLL